MRTLTALRLSVLIEQLRANNELLETLAVQLEWGLGPLPARQCREQIARNNEAIRKSDSSVVTFPADTGETA